MQNQQLRKDLNGSFRQNLTVNFSYNGPHYRIMTVSFFSGETAHSPKSFHPPTPKSLQLHLEGSARTSVPCSQNTSSFQSSRLDRYLAKPPFLFLEKKNQASPKQHKTQQNLPNTSSPLSVTHKTPQLTETGSRELSPWPGLAVMRGMRCVRPQCRQQYGTEKWVFRLQVWLLGTDFSKLD